MSKTKNVSTTMIEAFEQIQSLRRALRASYDSNEELRERVEQLEAQCSALNTLLEDKEVDESGGK